MKNRCICSSKMPMPGGRIFKPNKFLTDLGHERSRPRTGIGKCTISPCSISRAFRGGSHGTYHRPFVYTASTGYTPKVPR